MKTKEYYVYILASKKNGTLYVGVTNDLRKRTNQHRRKVVEGFVERYDVDLLVHFETYREINVAIAREKLLKKWYRKWKIALIESKNSEWKDLYKEMEF